MRLLINKTFPFLALLSLGFFHSYLLKGQVSRVDSLDFVYESGEYSQDQELSLLKELSRETQDPQKKLDYSQRLIKRINETDSIIYLYDALMQEGSAFRLISKLPDALNSFLKASKIAQDMDSARLIALSNVTIGDVYSVMGNHENSVRYYRDGIEQLRSMNSESIDLATALLNAGDEYFNAAKYDSAMDFFYESSMLFKKLDFEIGSAYNLGNMGMVYAKQGKDELAKANINEAVTILEDYEDYYAISTYLSYIADIYLEQGSYDEALAFAKRSLALAQNYELRDQMSQAHEELSKVYETYGQPANSLYHYKEYIRFRDSVNNVANVQKLANLRTDFELSKKQIEVDLINQQKENQSLITKGVAGGLVVLSIFTFALFRRNKVIKRTSKKLSEERKKSNDLLRNILPEETAEELKENGSVKAKKYSNTTVLFSDFKDFTRYAEQLPPEELVKTIDIYFSEFDRIMDKYQIEKIKTIGDSYMCASGLPNPDKDHAKHMVLAAKEMLSHVEQLKQVHAIDEARFDIRIGIHSGPVVAGVVGERKFAYDIWGDTVNIASRLESSCEPGKINVSESTYQLLSKEFQFEPRGKIEIKNSSPIEMYYLQLD